jgi:hypothetical protein
MTSLRGGLIIPPAQPRFIASDTVALAAKECDMTREQEKKPYPSKLYPSKPYPSMSVIVAGLLLWFLVASFAASWIAPKFGGADQWLERQEGSSFSPASAGVPAIDERATLLQ